MYGIIAPLNRRDQMGEVNVVRFGLIRKLLEKD